MSTRIENQVNRPFHRMRFTAAIFLVLTAIGFNTEIAHAKTISCYKGTQSKAFSSACPSGWTKNKPVIIDTWANFVGCFESNYVPYESAVMDQTSRIKTKGICAGYIPKTLASTKNYSFYNNCFKGNFYSDREASATSTNARLRAESNCKTLKP